MGRQQSLIETRSFLLAHGDKPLTLSALKWSDGSPSPGTKSWLTDTSDFSQRATSKSPSLYSIPSTCSTQDFLPTPPPKSSLRLPQVPLIPTIRHRTPQACDKCRERKTKCSGHHPSCLRCNSRGLSCKYSARETRIRGSVKSRTLVQTFEHQPLDLFGETMERKTEYRGCPTPARHSRMGRQTTAFIRFPVENDVPKVPTMPVYTTVPVAGRDSEEFYWHQPDDLVPPSFRCNTWPRSSLDSNSNSVDKMRKPLHTSLPLLDNGWGHYDQISPMESVPARGLGLDQARLTQCADGYRSSLSKETRREPVVSGWRADQAFQLPMIEDQNFNEMVGLENFSADGFPTPYYTFDAHFLNGHDVFC